MRAEFWIEGVGDQYGTDTNGTGTYLYLATDQVYFCRLDDAQLTAHADGGGYGAGWQQPIVAEPVPLAEIPPLFFSEIMRDVDLFVGVASVGNDPAWADGGRQENERAAWNLHAFGDLSATAQTRCELLQRLVPKLKIADRCSFAEKFLGVRGDLRTYKIHLGSGNILMSPNDRYLCIVPRAGCGARRLFPGAFAAHAEAGWKHCDTASRRLALRSARLRPPSIPFRMTVWFSRRFASRRQRSSR